MLTINADQHSLFQNYHRPGEEKRMVVFCVPALMATGWPPAQTTPETFYAPNRSSWAAAPVRRQVRYGAPHTSAVAMLPIS
ncbi:hypothetical protein SAMN04487926_11765 [Paraburkholderia steynii]|uniref:Uncharacterized protein n=1 Tax=Paraburkholderia steynii TaxID=1245441 RepID=A0A7Z7BAY7_9BURK|nr:hypothetical protein SAMN04487926_11765 [Paraburkholderia steynii]